MTLQSERYIATSLVSGFDRTIFKVSYFLRECNGAVVTLSRDSTLGNGGKDVGFGTFRAFMVRTRVVTRR